MTKKAQNSNNKKPVKTPPANIRQTAAEHALALAGLEGWDRVELPTLANGLGITENDLLDHIRDKTDLLAAITHMIDRKTLKNISAGEGDTVRDRLFEIIMARFDVMNEDRDGLVSIMQSFKFDPVQALIHAPFLCRSMQMMLEAAGETPQGPSGALKISGLTGAFLKNLKVWAEDENPDLSKTMAALDRDLSRLEKAAEFLRF